VCISDIIAVVSFALPTLSVAYLLFFLTAVIILQLHRCYKIFQTVTLGEKLPRLLQYISDVTKATFYFTFLYELRRPNLSNLTKENIRKTKENGRKHIVPGKGKGKVHHRTGHEGPEEEYRCSYTLSLTSVLDRGGGQSHAPAALPPRKTRYPLYRRLGGPQDRSGRVRKISTPRGFDPRTVQPVASRYTDCAKHTMSERW